MPAYLKKDKDHDVLGNPIDPKKIDLPSKLFKNIIITLKGKKMIWCEAKLSLQCAKCLNVMQVFAYPDTGVKQRKFYTVNDCACMNMNNEI